MLTFVPFKNNQMTKGLNYSFVSISAIVSSNTINTILFLLNYSLSNFHRHHQSFENKQLLNFFVSLTATFSISLISN